jgi:hypothetical protein
MDWDEQDNKSNSSKGGYDTKPQREAYRKTLAGIRYHKGEKLSFVTIGFKRGSIIDVRTELKKLTTFIKRITGKRIEYSRCRVLDNKSPDGQWRIHIHMIWNAPYVKQALIVEKLEKYIGESCHVHIKLLDDNDKKAVRYLMQYMGNQYGTVRYDYSRGWLPEGYNEVWNEIKQDFYDYVPRGIREPMDEQESVFKLMTQSSPEWKNVGMIENMNAWIDEQRELKISNESSLTSQRKTMKSREKIAIVCGDKGDCLHYDVKKCREYCVISNNFSRKSLTMTVTT